jgi:hypothetical protein
MLEGTSKPIEVLLLVEDNAGGVLVTQEALKECRVAINLTVDKNDREAVEAFYGGKSWVGPNPGKDSMFHFTLPA